METREESLARWAEPSTERPPSLRVVSGWLSPASKDLDERVQLSDEKVRVDQIENLLQRSSPGRQVTSDDAPEAWHFQAIAFPRLRPGRLVLSFPKQIFHQIQDAWNLHPRTIEVFLANNGVFTTFTTNGRTSILLKVANSRTTGFDCISIATDPSCRSIHVLYHHLEDENSVFAYLLATPERCIDPYFFVAALYCSHHQHIETHRNTIDDTIQGIERQTSFGNPGRLRGSERRPSLDEYPALVDLKSTIQQLSYCQTDLAIIRHVARCCLDCGDWLVQVVGEDLLGQQDQKLVGHLQTVRIMVQQDLEYIRRRTVTLLSQVQQMSDRVQSQTNFMLSTITQSDAEYTAAIAVDGKRDGIAMKTIAILGVVFLPGTFVATLFSIGMFDWGIENDGGTSELKVSPSMWIYWAITVPLTVVTLLLWALWSGRERQKCSQRFTVYRTNCPARSEQAASVKVLNRLVTEKMV